MSAFTLDLVKIRDDNEVLWPNAKGIIDDFFNQVVPDRLLGTAPSPQEAQALISSEWRNFINMYIRPWTRFDALTLLDFQETLIKPLPWNDFEVILKPSPLLNSIMVSSNARPWTDVMFKEAFDKYQDYKTKPKDLPTIPTLIDFTNMLRP